jgi:hypothetical protein
VSTVTELIFVRAQRFTNFAIKGIYALRTTTGSNNLAKLQKSGQFPDELVKREGTQSHYVEHVASRTY